jgi:hypothetical protein
MLGKQSMLGMEHLVNASARTSAHLPHIARENCPPTSNFPSCPIRTIPSRTETCSQAVGANSIVQCAGLSLCNEDTQEDLPTKFDVQHLQDNCPSKAQPMSRHLPSYFQLSMSHREDWISPIAATLLVRASSVPICMSLACQLAIEESVCIQRKVLLLFLTRSWAD